MSVSQKNEVLKDEKSVTAVFNIAGTKKEDIRVVYNHDKNAVFLYIKGNYYKGLYYIDRMDKNSIQSSYTDGILRIYAEIKKHKESEIVVN